MVEVYVMGIQKTRRGTTMGRGDRKVSYKQCDIGFLVIYDQVAATQRVDGKFIGFKRNGHMRIVLD